MRMFPSWSVTMRIASSMSSCVMPSSTAASRRASILSGRNSPLNKTEAVLVWYQLERQDSMLARPQTVEEWMQRLESRSLKFLQDQTSPQVRGYNGKMYDTAVVELIKKKMAAGETVERSRLTYAVQREDEGGKVEIVPYGGKGGSLRIVHPKE